MAAVFLLGFTLCGLLTNIHGYAKFLDDIPNGRSVPDPCDNRRGADRDNWYKVGHMPPALEKVDPQTRKINKNPFGKDFLAANVTFTPKLCRMDSDGDGIANWDELGIKSEKYCDHINFKQYWKYFSRSRAKSHPGLCERDSQSCIASDLRAENFCMPRANIN